MCSNRQARRERAVDEMGFSWLCVDVGVYIEGYIFVFWYTEEMGVIYAPFLSFILSENQKLKIKKLADDVGVC